MWFNENILIKDIAERLKDIIRTDNLWFIQLHETLREKKAQTLEKELT